MDVNESFWKIIALVGVTIVWFAAQRFFNKVDRRFDKQDEMLRVIEANQNAQKVTSAEHAIILTDHTRRLLGLEASHIVHYPERK